PELIDELISKIKKARPDILVMSGSRPAGVGTDVYKRLMECTDAKTYLDTEGGALRLGIESKNPPYMIKPNLFELETAYEKKFKSRDEIAEFCLEINSKGVRYVCVSMGKDGALITGGEKAFYSPAPNVKAAGVQGAGDSMVAGMIYAHENHFPMEETLRCGIAAASASIVREGTQLCTRECFEEMLALVDVVELF
ncbi:MAG: PfkB family carbohydrate kinase, partial [Defluviitaleaceae bacterium]|nr:PfkB family carbohydrate kinase [Defluviitaleaceae bacterium]